MENTIKDMYSYSKSGETYGYRTGMLTYEEYMSNGNFAVSGWNGAGFPQNVLDAYPTKFDPKAFGYPETFNFEVNGASLAYSWQLGSGCNSVETLDSGAEVKHCKVTLTSKKMPVRVVLHTILDGTDAIERYLEIENCDDKPINIGNLVVMGGALYKTDCYADCISSRKPEKAFSLGYFDYSVCCREGAFSWHDIPSCAVSISGKNRRQMHRHPMAIVKNNASGAIMMIELAYSGAYTFLFDNNAEYSDKGENAALSYSIKIDETNPLFVLKPKQKLRTPSVHVAYVNGDLDDVINAMHEHLRTSWFTLPAALNNIKGGIIEGGMGPERTMDAKAVKHFIDTAQKIGAETMIIDAGWYCGPGDEEKWWTSAGDWNYSKELYPDGLDELREYAHKKGILFGMWLDAERIGCNSLIAKQHPEWVVLPLKRDKESLLDMSNPQVVEWVERQISHLVDDYKIDVFRLDYNINPYELQYVAADGGSGYFEYTQAVYAMYERLRIKYPKVIFENCAGGGGRTDLGIMKNFTHTWVSDCQTAPTSALITNGMTMALPPEYVDRLASGMGSHTMGSLDFIIRHTLFGRPTSNSYNTVGTPYNEKQIEFVRHSYDLYKTYVRPYACEGKIYHHTPEFKRNQPFGTLILERSDKDKTIGLLGVFALSDTEETVTVYPRGIDVSKTYEVLFDNSRQRAFVSGFELKNSGIKVSLTHALTSELIAYKVKK